ncbi:hypothetical protein DWB58_31910, partial [candidate division KSB1 bacterium]|nr:hypothetical protein [candidate division KSB1 bacterium]
MEGEAIVNKKVSRREFLKISGATTAGLIALVGAPGDPAREALEAELARHFLPAKVVAHAEPAEPAGGLGAEEVEVV